MKKFDSFDFGKYCLHNPVDILMFARIYVPHVHVYMHVKYFVKLSYIAY